MYLVGWWGQLSIGRGGFRYTQAGIALINSKSECYFRNATSIVKSLKWDVKQNGKNDINASLPRTSDGPFSESFIKC